MEALGSAAALLLPREEKQQFQSFADGVGVKEPIDGALQSTMWHREERGMTEEWISD